MKVSIIVPTLNAEKHFPAFKEALEKQTMQAFEIVIMDSKSRDKTTQLFEEMGARVFSVDNFQHGRVRNEGASHAAGEILVGCEMERLGEDLWI